MPSFERALVPRDARGWPQRSVGDLFSATAGRQPQNVALVDGDRRLTFAALERAVDGVSTGLRALGVGAGDVVAYQLPNWWEAVAVFLATARLGAIANPLIPAFREAELRFTLAESGARALFIPGVLRGFDHRGTIASVRSSIPSLEHVVVCRDEAGVLLPWSAVEGEARPITPHVDPDSLLLLMYTSGTTSAPKGVLHTHNTLAAEILSLARVHGLGPGDRSLMPSPVTHISGVIHAILTPAILGTSAVLMDRWDAAEALRRIAAERVTYMAGAPTFLQEMLRLPRSSGDECTSLRLFSCGGASVSPELVREARARFPSCVAKRVYGSTEFPTISTTSPEDALARGIETEGRAIAPAEIRIVRGDGTAAAAEEGEVQARGPECFVGYADPSMNDEAFTPDGWFRTGDLGVLDDYGYLRITGRLKEIVVRKGEKISVREVEEAIASHPAVVEVAVLAVPDAETGERAEAAIVLRAGASLTLAELGEFLTRRGLARLKHPERLHVVDAMPRTESGKVAKAALAERLRG